jgi:glycerol-3-phosphate O-acyltransferase
MTPISEKYGHVAKKMVQNSVHSAEITENNVYQRANPQNRELINGILRDLLLPESAFLGVEHIEELYELSQEGKSCLLLMEHYSNFDIPCFYYLVAGSSEQGAAIADSVISMAGLKLNESSAFVLAFTESYNRIVIYPSRYLRDVSDEELYKRERKKSSRINMAALREMVRKKHEGSMILVFPSGTRYRPGNPETKRGLKEIDSYIKTFDHMVMIGIAGNILRVSEDGDMTRDLVTEDVVLYKASPVMDCRSFRHGARAAARGSEDPKQVVADAVMAELEEIHGKVERTRLAVIGQAHPV